MLTWPISSPSLSIGTPTNERAPACVRACVTRIRREVSAVPHLLCLVATAHDVGNHRVAPPQFFVRRWGIMHGNHAKLVALEQRQRAEFRSADTSRVG